MSAAWPRAQRTQRGFAGARHGRADANRRRAGIWAIAWVLVTSGPVMAAPPGGPQAASADGRARVRGDRPARASIHAPWVPPASEPEAGDRDALAAFDASRTPRSTIAGVTADPWMLKLSKPKLPVRWTRGLVDYLTFFVHDERGKAMMRAWLRRAGRYENTIRAILREHEVPDDLVWVVMAESGFNPRVRSAVGAAGPWQFMESTGAVYGLAKDYWVDERFDVERSTHAAATYLQDLHVRFGSWELALAAYNAGYGLVMTAIERNNTNNFWALCEIESGLPHATVNYVPKIIAAALVARNREALGFDRQSVVPLAAVPWATVQVARSISLTALAKQLGEDPDLLLELNAHLVRGRTPPHQRSWPVKIPTTRAQNARAAAKAIAGTEERESIYVVREGDRLEQIAARFGISERDLRRQNGVLDAAEVTKGVTLVVPAVGSADPPSGDGGRPLAAVPDVAVRPDERRVFLEITRASTPASIAAAFDQRWDKIVSANDLDPQARLQPGQLLQVIVPLGFDAAARGVALREQHEVEVVIRGSRAHIEAGLQRRGKLRRAIKARRGDTLERIGRRFGLTPGDLARINGFARDHELAADEIVVVYVDASRRKATIAAPEPRAASGRGLDPSLGREDDVDDRGARASAVPSRPTRSRSSAPAKPSRAPSTPGTSRVPGHGGSQP